MKRNTSFLIISALAVSSVSMPNVALATNQKPVTRVTFLERAFTDLKIPRIKRCTIPSNTRVGVRHRQYWCTAEQYNVITDLEWDGVFRRPITRREAISIIDRLLNTKKVIDGWIFPSDKATDSKWIEVPIGNATVIVPSDASLDRKITSSDVDALLLYVNGRPPSSVPVHKTITPLSGKLLVDAVISRILSNYLYIDAVEYIAIQNGQTQRRLPNLDSENVEHQSAALTELVISLHDEFSAFYPAELIKNSPHTFNALDYPLAGIGINFMRINDSIIIRQVLANAPAKAAGLLPGDRVLAIDRNSVEGMSQDEVRAALLGTIGSSVVLTIRRGELKKNYTILRKLTSIPEISITWEGDIAVISIRQFGETTQNLFPRTMLQVAEKEPAGIVLDIRGNEGGLVSAIDGIVSSFVGPGKNISITRDRSSSHKDLTTQENTIPTDIPVYVLIDEYTAAGAEIVASALQDLDRAKILGRNTMGYTTIQEIVSFQGGETLKLTIAEWLRSDGSSLSHKGVRPDITLQATEPNTELQEVLSIMRGGH